MSSPKILLLLAAAAVAPVYATVIFASGAGYLPSNAEDLTNVSPTEIIGSVSDPTTATTSVAMFKFNLLDPVNFSAITVAVPDDFPDTVLTLFDASGLGVYMNDDISGGDTLSCLPSQQTALSNPCPNPSPIGVGPLAPGVYYLAVSVSENYPISNNLMAGNGEIFSPASTTDVVGPDPLNGGPYQIDGWDGDIFDAPDFDQVHYDILLTGTTPEPATWIMTGAAGAVIMLLRRRTNK